MAPWPWDWCLKWARARLPCGVPCLQKGVHSVGHLAAACREAGNCLVVWTARTLICGRAVSALTLQQNWVVVTETVRAPKWKIFTMWLFTGRVSLLWGIDRVEGGAAGGVEAQETTQNGAAGVAVAQGQG